MEKTGNSRQSLLVLFACTMLLFSVTSVAFADVTDDRKKIEEKKAKEYQKKILNFDYDKIKNKDKGFKFPIPADIHKKIIQRYHPANFKIIPQ